MAGDVVITIKGVDRMSDVLVKIGKHAKDSGKDLEKLGKDGKKMGDDIERGAKRADTALRTFERTSLAVGAALGALALATIRVSAASQAQERQMAALNRLYGEAGERAIDYAESIQDATRFSNDAARESLVLLNTLTRNYGFSQDQIEQLLSRSADLAQLHGRTLNEVTQMVSNALRGEGEYIEQIGVAMNQNFVASQAAARGMQDFIGGMTDAEQAAFRFTLLMEQTADAQGYAMERAQGMSGAFAMLINEAQDGAQAFGSWLGPVRDLAAEFNAYALWMPLIASQTARVSAILVNSARSGQMAATAMGMLRFAMSPLGIIMGVLAVGATTLGLKWLEQRQAAEQLAAQLKMSEQAYRNLQNTVNSFYETGNQQSASWAAQQAKAAHDTVNEWQRMVDLMGKTTDNNNWFTDFSNTVSEGFGSFLGAISMEGSAIESFGDFWEGAGEDWNAEAVKNMQIGEDEEAQIYDSINRVFNLANNPNLDVEQFQRQFALFWNKLWLDVSQGEIAPDRISEEIDKFADRVTKSLISVEHVLDDFDFQAMLDDLRIDGLDEIANDVEQFAMSWDRIRDINSQMMEPALGGAGFFDAKRFDLTQRELESVEDSMERIQKLMMSGDFDNPAVNEAVTELTDLFLAGKINSEQFVNGLYELSTGMSAFKLDTDDAVSSALKMKDALGELKQESMETATALKTTAEESARTQREQLEAFYEAQQQIRQDFIAAYTSAFGMDDPLSQINMSSLTNQFTQLAEAIGNAGNTMDTVFRVIVENTNAIGQQAQGVYDWAEALINVEGELGKIDDLLARNIINQTQYSEAQTAFNDIARENAEIQDNILRIQTMQAPFIRDHMAMLENTTNELADQSAEQQRITLGWMDSATAAQAYTLITQAAQVANGELGASGEAAFKSMIEGAIAVNPFLFDMLESIGLVQGTMDDFTVSFDGITEGVSEIERLTMSIDALNETLGGTNIPDIEVGVTGEEALDGLIEKLKGLDTGDREINVKTNFDMGSTGGPLEGLINDMFGGKPVTLAPVTIPVTPDFGSGWASNQKGGAGGVGGMPAMDPITVPVEPEFQMADIYEQIPTDTVPGPIIQFGYNLDLVTGALIAYNGVTVTGPVVEFSADVDDVMQAQNDWGQSLRIIGPLVEFGSDDTLPTSDYGEWVGYGTIDGPTIRFLSIDSDPNMTLDAWQGYGTANGPTINFLANDDAPQRALGEWVSKGSFTGPTIVFQADTSAVSAALAAYSGSAVIGTRYVDVVTRSIGGGLPKFAHGGVTDNMVLFKAAEGDNPEIAHFANGGSTVLDREGLYLAPPATLITPSNAVRGTGHGQINVYINAGDFYGGSRPDLDEWAVRSLVPAMAEEFQRERLASGMDA